MDSSGILAFVPKPAAEEFDRLRSAFAYRAGKLRDIERQLRHHNLPHISQEPLEDWQSSAKIGYNVARLALVTRCSLCILLASSAAEIYENAHRMIIAEKFARWGS